LFCTCPGTFASVLVRIGAAALAGVVLALAFEPVGASYLIPFAVAAYVLVTHDLPVRRAWLPGLVFGIAFCYVLMFWMRVVGYDAWAALSGMEAVFYGLLGLVAPVLYRYRAWPVLIAVAWVAMEAIRSSWPFSGMPWGRLAYATAGTPWEKALPYVGNSGVSLLLALLGTGLAWLVLSKGRARFVPAATVAGVLAVSLVPALVPYAPDISERTTVAVVQGNVPGDGDDILLDHRQVTRNHVDATTRLADEVAAGERPEPAFVLWPENSTAVDPFEDAEINADIEQAVQAIDVPILVGGMVDAGPEHVLNQGIVWDPDTGGGDRYTKWHPVPFGEYIPWRSIFRDNFGRLALIPRDMIAGTRTDPLDVAGIDVADAICFDVAYDDGIHAQLREGADLLVVQTSNAMFIHTSQIDQQFEITRLRAIETGRYVLVAATNGVSGVIAPDGTVLDRADPRTQEVLVEEIGLSRSLTPAVRIGPWLDRACIAVTLLALALGVLPYRRSHPKKGRIRA
jgi:apolipoprotein N-acyltransferase